MKLALSVIGRMGGVTVTWEFVMPSPGNLFSLDSSFLVEFSCIILSAGIVGICPPYLPSPENT